jgi:uncharacterized membrane protein
MDDRTLQVIAIALILLAVLSLPSMPMHMNSSLNTIILIAAIFLLLYPYLREEVQESETQVGTASVPAEKSGGTCLPDRLKKLLSEDEATIIEIIGENEGITQDSLHFRTGFSHSKLSTLMKRLEEKDLIVREKFGKTYKVYLADWVREIFEG